MRINLKKVFNVALISQALLAAFLFIPMTGILKLICDRVEGLEAWGLLIGVDEVEKPKRKIPTEALKE